VAYDEALAQQLRDDLAPRALVERKMFGGLCIMHRGHMLCGIHKGGGMFRVGRDSGAAALAVPGARPMTFTGRPMPGMVETDPDLLADPVRRRALLDLALGFNAAQPAKEAGMAKPRKPR
jgi:TfoX/Sxy family transcriptional regulator of competence genes